MTNITTLLDERDPAIMFERDYGRSLIRICDTDPELQDMRQRVLLALEENHTRDAIEAHFNADCDEQGYDKNYDECKFSFLIESADMAPNIRYPLFLYMQMHNENRPLLSFDNEDLYLVLLGRCGLRLVKGGPYSDVRVQIIDLTTGTRLL